MIDIYLLENEKETTDEFSEYLILFQEHKDTLDPNNPRDLIDIYLLEIGKDTTDEFTEDNLIMNVVDLFAAGKQFANSPMS